MRLNVNENLPGVVHLLGLEEELEGGVRAKGLLQVHLAHVHNMRHPRQQQQQLTVETEQCHQTAAIMT